MILRHGICVLVVGFIVVACTSPPLVAVEAGADTSTPMDDAGRDADACTKCADVQDAGTTCLTQTRDFTPFMPPSSVIPPRPSIDACSPKQIADHFLACLDASATTMSCNAWRQANTTCSSCLASNDTDSAWGPLIFGSGLYVTGGTVQANYEGCLVKLGYQECADASFRQGLCTKFACEEHCPVIDEPSYQLYVQCTNKASSSSCKAYSDKMATSCAVDAAPNIAACRGTSFKDYYDKIAPMFCSSGG